MIYFDNASTTPVTETAINAINKNDCFNPSAPHALGLRAERAGRNAAETLAGLLSFKPDEIVFTSGGTESNNLALLGAAFSLRRRGGHILAAPAEHPSVLEPLKYLERNGFEITYARPHQWGAFLRGDTVLCSMAHVNGETGDINPVAETAAAVKQFNTKIIIHCDGAQGFGKTALPLNNIDLYSFSAHKLHGFKGSGGLAVRGGVRLTPLMLGGGQQNGIRPGTENMPGILSLTAAANEAFKHMNENRARVSAVKQTLASLADELPGTFVNASPDSAGQSPYILNMSFTGVKGAVLVNMLSEREIYISTGASCRARKGGRSPLLDMGIGGMDGGRADSAVRFSFSPLNTVDEAETVKRALIDCVAALRKISA